MGSRYRWYVVWLLFALYVLNFVDRQILFILMEPIRLEFGFTDTQLGMLGGLAFAVLYSTLGIPIARLADRTNRVNIISVSVFVWSLATVLTGMARNFSQLLVARIAVGVGEAGLSPPAYSLLADYFSREKRTTAIAIYSMGIYTGVFVGYLSGAVVAETWGWRAAFWVVGLPGIFMAVLVKLTLREPPRGFADGEAVPLAAPPFMQVVRKLGGKSTFIHLAMAAALHSFVGYGVTGFHPSFLIRTHGFSVAEVGVILSMVAAISGVGGTWFGGYLADRLSNNRSDIRWQLWVPGISTLLNVPVAIAAYSLSDKSVVITMLFISLVFGVMYLAPTFSTLQRLVRARERALGTAVLFLVINLIGLGLGPYLVGVVSDAMNTWFLGDGLFEEAARAQGLRWALGIMVCVNIWSFIHYMLAARTLEADTEK